MATKRKPTVKEIQVIKGTSRWYINVVQPRNGIIVLHGQHYFSKFNAVRAAKQLAANNNLTWRIAGEK